MNLPNKLTVLRMAMVPFFVGALLWQELPHNCLIALLLFLAASYTDHLDGKIARSRNLITNFGKFMDPLADKITQVVVVICLAMRFRELIPLVVICFLKELIQGLGGIFLLKKGAAVHGAKWYGKVSTFVFYGVMALIVLLPNMPFPLRVTLIALVIVLMLFSFVQYIRLFFGIKKAMPAGTDGEITAADSQKDSKSA